MATTQTAKKPAKKSTAKVEAGAASETKDVKAKAPNKRPVAVEELLHFSESEGFMVEPMGREAGAAGIDALRRYVSADHVNMTDAEVAIGVACVIKHIERPLQRIVYDRLRTDSEFCDCLKAVIASSFAERDPTPFKRTYDYVAAMCGFPPEKE